MSPVFGQQFPDYIEKQIKSGAITREEAKQLYPDKVIAPTPLPPPIVPAAKPQRVAKPKAVPQTADGSCASSVTISKTAVAGQIHGQPFRLDTAEFKASTILELKQGKDFFPELGLVIFLFTEGPLDGKSFSYVAGGSNPHLHVKWRKAGASVPETDIKTDGYQLQLQFGQRQGQTLPGKIYACIPGTDGSKITGTFSATLN